MKLNFTTVAKLNMLLILCSFLSLSSIAQFSNIAYWNFDAAPYSGAIPANTGSGTLYLNGTNGSSSGWNTTTFGGSTGEAIAFVGSDNNGKHMVFRFSMTDKQNARVTFQTRGTGTGYTTGTWAYSDNGTTWTTIPGNTASTSNNFSQKQFTTTGLDGKSTAYLRYTLTGASSSNGNNRVDEFYIAAEPGTTTITPCATPAISAQPVNATVTIPGTATFNVSATNVTAYQWQWRANASGTWANVTAAQGTGGTTTSFTTVPTTQTMNGYEYRVVLTNACGGGSTTATLNSNVATLTANCTNPVINMQPLDTTVILGIPAAFVTDATGVNSYQWQWRANSTTAWADVTAAEGAGGTTDSFTTVPATPQMSGYQYRVILTNACGTIVTDSATLNICTSPVVTTQPSDTIVTLGNVAVFEVEVANVSTYQWQWRASSTTAWADVTAAEGAGGTTDSFTTVPATQQMNGYQYRVVVTNLCGGTLASTVFTDSAILNICMSPVLAMQPSDTTVTLGDVAIFEVAATNVTGYQWQWRANNTANWSDATIADGTGATTNSFTTIAATQQMNGYQYRVILTNMCGATTVTNMQSDNATLTICMPPVIMTQVVNTTVVAGTSAVFEVEATNATGYQWQWRASSTANWSDATIAEGTGATTDSFTTIATTMAMTGYQYRVVVTNECGTHTITHLVSDTGILTVVCPPVTGITAQPVNVMINLGANALFTVSATGAAAYQWQAWDALTSAWVNIAPGTSGYTGQNTDSLIITAPGLDRDGSKYRVLLSNLCATTSTSLEAILTIDAGINVVTNPVSILNTNGFTSQTTFINTGIGQLHSEGIRYSADGITWNPLVAGGVINNLQPNTKYFYQGYATFNIGTFYGAVLDTFTLANVPGPTTLNALAGGTTIDLTVNPGNNPAYTQYAIASGTSWVQINGTLSSSAAWQTAADWNAVTISELTPNTNYCFAVKAKNNDGVVTVLNTEACIRTAVNVSVKDITTALNSQVAIYPNPSASGMVQLKYSFATPVDLNVSVTDLSGKVVFTTDLKDLRTGQQTLDLRKLAQGMYFMKLSADGQSAGKKLIIAK